MFIASNTVEKSTVEHESLMINRRNTKVSHDVMSCMCAPKNKVHVVRIVRLACDEPLRQSRM